MLGLQVCLVLCLFHQPILVHSLLPLGGIGDNCRLVGLEVLEKMNEYLEASPKVEYRLRNLYK